MTLPATAAPPNLSAAEDDALAYRSVYTGAVLGLLLGVLSGATALTAGSSFETTLLLTPIPLLAIAVSLTAWRVIRAAPEQYTGGSMALSGAALGVLFLVLGVGYGSYVYATEVPDGYARTSFLEMKPSEADVVNREYIPHPVSDYIEGAKPIFIKGYIRPDSVKFTQNISDFLLVRDNQECCFGDLSKVQFFDQIKVSLAPGLTTDFSRGLFRVGGKLRIGPPDPELNTPITYTLEADYVK
ncbi:MAG: hypothetical protein ACRCT8_01910 [Lacipirellulaceae bacterium]